MDTRSQAKLLNTKVEALDWVDSNSTSMRHADSCAYLDDTGYPAPCTCGHSSQSRIPSYIHRAIEAYQGN